MKTNKSAFTLIELMVTIVILMMIVVFLVIGGIFIKGFKKSIEQDVILQEQNPIGIGDVVYISSLSITGVVNFAYQYSPVVNIIVKDTNGIPQVFKEVNKALLKKVISIEK